LYLQSSCVVSNIGGFSNFQVLSFALISYDNYQIKLDRGEPQT